MDKTKMMKAGLSVLGLALTLGSTLINDKMKNDKLEETVSKKVAEALNNQAKES